MKLGFVSAIFPELPIEAVLAFARAEGFACIEIPCASRSRTTHSAGRSQAGSVQ